MTLCLTPVLGDHSDAATRGLVRYDLEQQIEVEIEGWGDKTRGWGDPIPKIVFEKIATINNYQHNFITTTILNDIIIDMIQFSSIKIITFTHILKNNILSSKKVEKDIKLA